MLVAVSCQNQNDDPFTDYINFTSNETDTVFFLSQSIGDAFDNVSIRIYLSGLMYN